MMGIIKEKILRKVMFWWCLWFVSVIGYAYVLQYNIFIQLSDHIVFILQVILDITIGYFSWLSWRRQSDPKLKVFLKFVFISICLGLLVNETYNVLINIFNAKISLSVNAIWIITYNVFLIMQVCSWTFLLKHLNQKIEAPYKKNHIKSCFYQASALILLSVCFTQAVQNMLQSTMGIVQISNTVLEIALFSILIIVLAKSKNKSLSYLATGFLLLAAFNLAQRFSYMSGHSFKTFDVAWLISFVYMIFGFIFFASKNKQTINLYPYNSLHVMTSAFLMIFTTTLCVLFLFTHFFISSLELKRSGEVLLFENLPSILIFVFTVAIILSKYFAEKISSPLQNIIKKIRVLEDRGDGYKKESMNFPRSDIDEMNNVSDFVEKSINKLQVSNQSKAQFIMNISHDFRTPASGIHAMSKLIHTKIQDAKLKHMQSLIVGSSKQLLNLLDEVLEHSSLERGAMPLEIEIANVNQIVSDLLIYLSSKIIECDLHVKQINDNQTIKHPLDIQLFRNVILNLLTNAIKFTEPGGHITIAITKDESRLSISIEDTGIGVPLDRQEVIFEPFVRATQTETTKKYAGIGLGLANVKLMVNRMGGSIKLRSIPGCGTTFIIVFPG